MLASVLPDHICPISRELPVDPVIGDDGRVYERKCIQDWLSRTQKSPVTNEPMGTRLYEARHVFNLLRVLADAPEAADNDDLQVWKRLVDHRNRVETFPSGKIKIYKNGEFVRMEYAEKHPKHGEIHFIHNQRTARMEFANSHPRYGQIQHFDDTLSCIRREYKPWHVHAGVVEHFRNDKHERTEYAEGHRWHGEIDYWSGGRIVRREFAPSHPKHGIIESYDADSLRTLRTYAAGHEFHGHIDYCEDGVHVRSEYESWHRCHGEIDFYDGSDNIVRREYGPMHHLQGCIDTLDFLVMRSNGLAKCMRRSFPESHANSGEIHFYNRGMIVSRHYTDGHMLHGCIDIFNDDEDFFHREYAAGHRRHGEMTYYEKNAYMHTKYAYFHPDHGCIDVIRYDQIVRRTWPAHINGGRTEYFGNGFMVRSKRKRDE